MAANPPCRVTNRWRPDNLLEAAQALRHNQVIGFPTETVYGLGGNALSDLAVSRIFHAKGRPSDNPLIVHVADLASVYELVRIDDETLRQHVEQLSEEFWPGPLTMVLKQRSDAGLSQLATAGLDSVGVRIPGHDLALQLLRTAGVPVAAPSANTSGKPSPTTAQHVHHDLDGRIAGVLDGGSTSVGLESTVVDMSRGSPYTVLRPGQVTFHQLQRCLGAHLVRATTHSEAANDQDAAAEAEAEAEAAPEAPRAPGMKYAHYAPSAPLFVYRGTKLGLLEHVRALQQRGERVGVLSPVLMEDLFRQLPAESVKLMACGSAEEPDLIARQLYDCLRRFDSDSDAVDSILCYGFPSTDIGEAILNRLLKASQSVVGSQGSPTVEHHFAGN